MSLEDVLCGVVLIAGCGDGAVVDENRRKLIAILIAEMAEDRVCKALEYPGALLRTKVQDFGEQEAAAGHQCQQGPRLWSQPDLGEAPHTVERAVEHA